MNLLVKDQKLRCGELIFPCAVGRGGVRAQKIEGDGATPEGCFALDAVMFRPDRLHNIVTGLPAHPLTPGDAWCDDPSNAMYNQLVTLPFAGRHEILWRNDTIYDIIVVIDYNRAPSIPGRGSAIFLHIARDDYTPTDGCVALALPHLQEVLARCMLGTKIAIAGM
jgi:L,D-peptidoglycan transpeptidase YkuD (ErfK/YbiS/YcfS/YnhG family)